MRQLRLYAVIVGGALALASVSMAQAGQLASGQQDKNNAATQGNTPSPSHSDLATQQLTELLNLDAAQSAKVRDVLEQEHIQLIALHNDPTLSPEEKQSRWQRMRQKAGDDIMAVLTPAQQKKLVDALRNQQPTESQPASPHEQAEPPTTRESVPPPQ